MTNFLERAKRLKIEIDPRLERLAELQDFERQVSEDRAMLEDALRPTFLHDVILENVRVDIGLRSGPEIPEDHAGFGRVGIGKVN